MIRTVLTLVSLIWGATLFAQFSPAPVFPADTSVLFADLAQRINAINIDTPEEYLEKYAKINEDRQEELQEGIRDSLYLFHPELQKFLDQLMTEIVVANDLDISPIILIRRSQVPNAASYGDGIFMVNLGLLQSLKTQDRIAFVLCHEMAHDRLGHQRKSMLEFCKRDLKLQAVRKKISRIRMRKSRRESLITGARASIYNSYRLKRENELEADSLGLQYYQPLGYSMKAVGSVIASLEERNLLDLREVDFKELLQTKAYPIKEKWLEAPEQMFGGSFGTDAAPEGFWAKDSLSTHPEMFARQAGLAVLPPPETLDTTVMETEHTLTLTVGRETIRAQFEVGAPGLAIINGLKLLAGDPENPTHRALLGEALLKTYRSIEDHDFTEAVPPENYFEDPNARLVIRMFHRMRKSELRKFTLAWMRERTDAFTEDEMSALLKRAETYFAGID